MDNPLRLSSLFRFLLRIPVPWVFVLAYLAGVGLERVRRSGVHPTAPRGVVVPGAALFIVGATIAGWGLVVLRRARTTTVPGEQSARLVTWGGD